MTRVQQLYELTKKTFSPGTGGAPPSRAASQRLLDALDSIACDDVGLRSAAEEASKAGKSAGQVYRSPVAYKSRSAPSYAGGGGGAEQTRWHPPITYLQIAETEHYSIGIFCLPASATIPMHNHPGMSVFSRLLYGRMHLRSYDWVDPGAPSGGDPKSTPRMARLVRDTVLQATPEEPCPSVSLFPEEGGNMHAFTALAPTAVLDVMGPPYAPGNGRDCTYYREVLSTVQQPGEGGEVGGASGGGGGAVIQELMKAPGAPAPEGTSLGIPDGSLVGLVEMEAPSDFVVRRGDYEGQIPGTE